MDERPAITRLGRFADPLVEQAYEKKILAERKAGFRPILLILAAVFALFLLADFISNRDPGRIAHIMSIRAASFSWLLALYLLFPKIRTFHTFAGILFLTELIISMSVLFISSLYENPDFMLQLLSVVLVIFAFYVVPGRFELMLAATLILWVFFLVLAMVRFSDVALKEWGAAVLFPLAFGITAASLHLRLEKEKRGQFSLNRQLEEMAWKDPLTDSFNRLKFDADLDFLLKRAKDSGEPFAVVLADVDDFKQINDCHGHLVGDDVLMKLAEIFRREVRKQDLVARWGGEEFVVLFPGATGQIALAVTRRMQQALETAEFGHGLHITCSFGISIWQESDDARILINRADRNLYLAKEQGKNRIVWSTL